MTNNNKENNNFLIGHWNCRSINNKKLLLNKILNESKYSIFCLNETMLIDNNNLIIENYSFIQKNRKVKKGGVGMLINKSLDFEIIKLKTTNINVIAWYLPPPNNKQTSTEINQNNKIIEEIFKKLETFKPFILCGDLNSHSTSWFCTSSNPRGMILEELILKHNFNIINTEK